MKLSANDTAAWLGRCLGLLSLLWATGCDPRERLVLVTVPGWPAGATLLRLAIDAPGAAQQTVEVTSQTGQVGLYVPAGQAGPLQIEAVYRDSAGCHYGRGLATADIGTGFRIETTLTQTLFSKPLCQCSTDGLCWSNPLPQGNQLNKIWSNGSESWAVGVGGIILKNSGQGWITLPSPTTQDLYSIYGMGVGSQTQIWAVGAAGTILRSTGGDFSLVASGVTETLRGVWVRAANFAWAVGDNGQALFWNGTTWLRNGVGMPVQLNDVHGVDNNDIWAVGEAGQTFHRTGTGWTAFPTGYTTGLSAVFANSATDIWTVGVQGVVLRSSG
ncbi:MAG TPA: hypothetical protein PKI03_10160, partial [Pseudomonadota bacterium]|nr:hypothetical protein [Pseudomonadota bacterium]